MGLIQLGPRFFKKEPIRLEVSHWSVSGLHFGLILFNYRFVDRC